MDVLPGFRAVKRQHSESRGGSVGELALGNSSGAVPAASIPLELGRLLRVVHYGIIEVVAEGCFPVMWNYIVRLHCYLVCNYIETPVSRDSLNANEFEIGLDELEEEKSELQSSKDCIWDAVCGRKSLKRQLREAVRAQRHFTLTAPESTPVRQWLG